MRMRRRKTARSEQDVRLVVIAEARRLGVPHERAHKGPGAATGFPDDKFYVYGGKPWLVEFKAPGKKVEPGSRQALIIDTLRRMGYDVEVHDNDEKAIAALRRRVDANAPPDRRR